ncbi:MAG TPA: hypothetical protein VGJ28_07865 [Micromonosporaceae bacterium]
MTHRAHAETVPQRTVAPALMLTKCRTVDFCLIAASLCRSI